MVKRLLKLSALAVLVFFNSTAKADSFFSSASTYQEDHIIPLVFIKDMEYYNNKKSSIYTKTITEYLSLEPEIIVTDDENLADFYLQPRLLVSKFEQISQDAGRYSISVAVDFIAKGGTLVDREIKNRYIIIEKDQEHQEIAKKLLLKLLKETIANLSLKIKNNVI